MENSNFLELYQVDSLPVLQNKMFDTKEAAIQCTKGQVNLVQNLDTGLIYNSAFQPKLMHYDSGYQNEQATSSVFKAHLDDVSAIAQRCFDGQRLVEVGCGKGLFLERLQDMGFDVRGFDPTYEGNNPQIKKEYFDESANIQADALILRHVLEHIENPYDFLLKLKKANGGVGKIYIEVPCFDWICQKNAWFDIFYEHVNYFRLSDLKQMFAVVHESGHFFSDQYIYIVADLASLQKPCITQTGKVNFPPDFLSKVDFYAHDIRSQSNRKVAVWGGASKGVLFAIFMQRVGVSIDFIVDINPAKQNKFLAITGHKVCSVDFVEAHLPEGSNVYVMNGNYLEEIRNMTANRYQLIALDD